MILNIFVLFILIIVNGVFSASELAFLSVDKYALNEKIKNGNKKAKQIKKLIDNPSGFLATIQIAITLAGFLASAFAAEAFADEIVKYLIFVPLSTLVLKTVVVIIVTIVLSYFTLVLGELVPKRIALAYPNKIAFSMVGVITILMKIAYPFVWLLTKSTNLVTKLFKIKEENEEDKITEEKIKRIVTMGKEEGAIEAGEKDLIFNIFKFNDIKVNQIMTKREYIVAINKDIDVKDLVNVIRASKYTRLPVYDEKLDNVIGILNVKDMIIKYTIGKQFNILNMINPPFFVNENEIIDDVFRIMQEKKQAMAIVLNENKQTVGILTIEDAIEEIVGNIFDEYD